MPYPGVPSEKVKKLDDCVERVMSSPSFAKTYKKRKDKKMTKKQLAIAICRSAMDL